MKTLLQMLALAVFVLLGLSACEKDDSFCEQVSQTGELQIGEITINVPGESSYSGVGALPGPFKIGKYEGEISSVVIKQTPTETGMQVELRHFFDDGNGNKFWTHDHATFTPVNGSQTVFNVYDEMAIWVGEGDFKCSGGMLINEGVVDFGTNKLVFNCAGTVCGGCN